MMMHILFYTRLLLYLICFGVPLIHPAIVVPYDNIGAWLWFLVVPAEMFISYYLGSPRLRVVIWLIIGGGFLLLAAIIIAGFSVDTLVILLLGGLSFMLTTLIFKIKGRLRVLAIIEVFALALIYYRIMGFSRSVVEIAQQSGGLTQLILLISISAFLIHGIVLYFASFAGSFKTHRRELLVFIGTVLPIVLVLALVLPPDFIEHSIELNTLDSSLDPETIPLDAQGNIIDGGNLRSHDMFESENGGQGQNGEQGNKQGRLQGLAAEQWSEGIGSQLGPSKQYAVMIISSKERHVYAAGAYYGLLDAERGMLYSHEQELNKLKYLHLIETWKNQNLEYELGRYPAAASFFSTLRERFVAYNPYAIEPTILDRSFHPFSYSYNTISLFSEMSPDFAEQVRNLDRDEREELSFYLVVPFSGERLARFGNYIAVIIDPDMGYYEKIQALLKHFRTFQYQLGFNEDTGIDRIEDFLYRVKSGDCTEFSHSSAILARLVGIPSRVVTGYLGSRDLQTLNHMRGLLLLKEQIKALNDIPLQELLLVTNMHRHSWVQFYLPQYGWIDFETTQYAIPPPMEQNPNNLDLVIPVIKAKKNPVVVSRFPYQEILGFLFIMANLIFLGLLIYRSGKEKYLFYLARKRNLKGLKALGRLLLMQLARRGYELKHPAQTITEYAEKHPELKGFARYYTTLRYYSGMDSKTSKVYWDKIKYLYYSIMKSIQSEDIIAVLKKTLTLRGIFY